MIEAFINTGK